MKLDLLKECNDQRVPPRDFMQTFCVRCRNRDCVNAGWAGSTFEERVSTQVERLLTHPIMARPEDTKFDPLRAMHFVEVPQSVVLRRRADPWAGPGVYLSEPDPHTVATPSVEDAVAKLAEARGKRPPMVSVEVEPELPVEAPPQPTPPVQVQAQPTPPPRPSVNTEFPEEGVMLGGGTPTPPRERLAPSDPWAPKPKVNVVPAGAKIKMGP